MLWARMPGHSKIFSQSILKTHTQQDLKLSQKLQAMEKGATFFFMFFSLWVGIQFTLVHTHF